MGGGLRAPENEREDQRSWRGDESERARDPAPRAQTALHQEVAARSTVHHERRPGLGHRGFAEVARWLAFTPTPPHPNPKKIARDGRLDSLTAY